MGTADLGGQLMEPPGPVPEFDAPDASISVRPSGITADALRDTMRDFATGVAIVATYVEHAGIRVHDAVTVNSLTSLSLSPPLVSISLRRDSRFRADLETSGVWSISILDGESQWLAAYFARERIERVAALGSMRTQPGPHTGALLFDAAGWLECVLERGYEVGDHTLFVGAVVGSGTHRKSSRLVFLRGGYHVLPSG
ncbi:MULTISPECIES: flavin reductase family protein [unclassified Nocardia]|uniref:flavin reductase family protein n=1 Tax=unclassified Nocardia TaxID=2637762 RepID=UPI001CE41AD5|nr:MULTISPECIES: flavin reductase family protein [unclassified Nocardia]